METRETKPTNDISASARHVEHKTDGDAAVLQQGELDSARISLWSVVGVQYSITASPIAIGQFLQLVVGAGGSPYFFWGLIVAISGQFLVAFSLAELAASYPHTSGMGTTIFPCIRLTNLALTRRPCSQEPFTGLLH